MHRHAVVAAVLFALAAAALDTFGEEVNVYSARHYDTDLALYDRFEETTGIKVNLIEGQQRRPDRAHPQ